MATKTVAVIGGLDADLIMIANRIPDAGESVLANEYLKALGGKGANSAIATYRSCHQKAFERSNDATQETHKTEVVGSTGRRRPGPTTPPGSGPVSSTSTNYSHEEDMDIRVRMIGAVGDDQYGARFIVRLNENGVDTSGIATVPNTRSSVCFVMVENHTRESRCLSTRDATASWEKEHFAKPEDLGGGMRPDLVIAQMEVDREVVEAMIETAGEVGIEFCLNAAPASLVATRTYWHLTHLLVNEIEAAILSGRDRDDVNEDTWPVIAHEFLGWGVKNVVITLGARGAYYANAESQGRCLAYEVDVVDTTGAGDTFTGAYASDYLRQRERRRWDIRSAVVRGNKAAAITIQRLGAQEGIPFAAEIDSFDAAFRDPDILTSTLTPVMT